MNEENPHENPQDKHHRTGKSPGNHSRNKADAPNLEAVSVKYVAQKRFKRPPSKGGRPKREHSRKIQLHEAEAANLLRAVFEKAEREHYTLMDITEFLGTSHATVSRWFNGHNTPRAKHLTQLKAFLQLGSTHNIPSENTDLDKNSLTEISAGRSSLNAPSLSGEHYEFESDLDNKKPNTKTTKFKGDVKPKRIRHYNSHLPTIEDKKK